MTTFSHRPGLPPGEWLRMILIALFSVILLSSLFPAHAGRSGGSFGGSRSSSSVSVSRSTVSVTRTVTPTRVTPTVRQQVVAPRVTPRTITTSKVTSKVTTVTVKKAKPVAVYHRIKPSHSSHSSVVVVGMAAPEEDCDFGDLIEGDDDCQQAQPAPVQPVQPVQPLFDGWLFLMGLLMIMSAVGLVIVAVAITKQLRAKRAERHYPF